MVRSKDAAASQKSSGRAAQQEDSDNDKTASRHKNRRDAEVKAIRAISNRYKKMSLNEMSEQRGPNNESLLDLAVEEFLARPKCRLRDSFYERAAKLLNRCPWQSK